MCEKSIFYQDELTCKPLDSQEDIMAFLENPPSWRTLCEDLKPHSKYLIRNIDINTNADFELETPQTFCHFSPDADDVKRHEEIMLPKTLVCHDMANGYHDDSMIDGTAQYDAYTFYNWAGIDIFCYFSHHLVTIPPLGWINVGHAHGVKVIGTVITEWSPGTAFWDEILKSTTEWQNFASALVAIAKTLKFDGWLLNIENKISQPSVLLEFVRYLHSTLHQELNDPVLIWYDSVTIEGLLTWQNGLNEKNKDFFDACDGIFTNYTWSEAEVVSSVAAAGSRLTDVYIGIDVWGRNFIGGGQFNTSHAVKIAHKHGCSLAIFAQAWTHEAIGEVPDGRDHISTAATLSKYDWFILRDRALWGSMWPFLNTRLPSTLPFKTSFCRGQGMKRRLYGEVICPGPWYNLRHMQYQPNSSHGPHGYILTTHENVVYATRRGLFQVTDTKDITICRESLSASQKSLCQSIEQLKSPDNSATSSTVVLREEHSEEKRQSIDYVHNIEQATAKRKIKDVLRNLFHKSRKTSADSETPTADREDPSDHPETETSLGEQSPASPKHQRSEKTHTTYSLVHVDGELECLELFLGDSFNGGSCLKVNPSDEVCTDHRTIRLFHCDFECDDLIACVVTKNVSAFRDQFLNIILNVTQSNGREFQVTLVGRSLPQSAPSSDVGVLSVCPLNHFNSASLDKFKEVQKYVLVNEPAFYVPVENSYGWKVWYYLVNLPPACRVTSVSCRTGLPRGPVLFGHFGLCKGFNSDNNVLYEYDNK